MATYLDTNSLDSLDATTPTGSEDPGLIDDAIREAKLVFKTVLKNHLTNKGGLRMAMVKYMTAAAVTGFTINIWQNLGTTTVADPTLLFQGGAFSGSVKPVAGVYKVTGFCSFYQCGTCQFGIRVATGTTTSTTLADLYGGIASAGGAGTDDVVSHAAGIWTTDGTVCLCMATLMSIAGQLGHTAGTGGAAGTIAMMQFEFLGAVVP